MIRSFKHKGLQRFFESDDARAIGGNMQARCRRILTILNLAHSSQDTDVAGYRLHPLTGDLLGFWSMKVNENWRIIFRFEDGDVYDVDLIDYH